MSTVDIGTTEPFGTVFLDRLGPSDRSDLLSTGRRIRLRAGTTILIEGQVSSQVLLLLEGRVRAWSNSLDGRESLLAIRRPGDLVGELSALDRRPHSATVSTLEVVEALAIAANSFRSFLQAHPDAAFAVLELITERLRDADRKRAEFGSTDTTGRVAARIAELADRHGQSVAEGVRIDLVLSQEELASWVGASREAVSRALRVFRERGVDRHPAASDHRARPRRSARPRRVRPRNERLATPWRHGLISAMLCPACGAQSAAGSRFCAACGEPLVRECPACQMPVELAFQFCPSCGQRIGQPTSPTASDATVEGPGDTRRRRIVALFADLVGFSTLAEHTDPEVLQGIVDGVFRDLSEETEAAGGHVERFIGDAVFATFGSRTANEDDPRRAVDVAFRMMERLRARSVETSISLRLRIGINSGLVVMAPVAGGPHVEVFGDAANVAARLQQAAAPDEILVGASVWRRVRDHYEGSSVGLLRVKGREEAVEAYRILGRRSAGTRKQAPFVGRRDELALLELLWSNTLKGNTHVVSLMGEAGVGKSRLLAEFVPRRGANDTRVVCRSDQTFWPIVQIVHSILGTQPATLTELQAACRTIPGIDEEVVGLLAALLGVGGPSAVIAWADEHQKRQMFAGLWLFVLAAASVRPLLIILDDLHWADRSSVDLISFLLERLGAAPVMVLLAFRPGFEHLERAAIRSSHTAVRLEPLSVAESVALARGYLGVADLPEDLERLVAQRAEGNPFFIEELLQALVELGSLAVRDDRAILGKVDVDIPDTVEGTILARLDRLPSRSRGVLHHASVVGRTFSTELLHSITGEDDLEGILDELSRAQLIVVQGPGQWAFKHSLIQEVTYGTLLLRRRRELHRLVAEALEASAPQGLELLAEHYAKAEIPEQARAYAEQAGDAASERMGFVEAIGRYETALRLWGKGDEKGRLSVVMKLAAAQVVAADLAAAAVSLIEAEAGWRALGNFVRAGEALATLGRVYFWMGDAEQAEAFFDRSIAMLEAQPQSPELVKALTWAAALETLTMRLDRLEALASRGLAMQEDLVSPGARSSLLTSLGRCEVLRGEPNGVARIRASLELAERSREAEPLARAYINLILSLSDLHEPDALDTARQGRDAARRLGALSFDITMAGREAGILVSLGRYDEAKAVAEEILDARNAVVAPATLFAAQALADALLRRGAYVKARRRLDEVFPLVRRMGGGAFLIQAYASQAELEEARGNRASARLAIEAGLEVAMTTSALLYAFACLVPAARILDKEARPLLDRLSGLPSQPWFDAQRFEAAAHLRLRSGGFEEAAEIYARLGLPYEECRARLEAGDHGGAVTIADRLGLRSGPLATHLQSTASRV